MKKAFDILELAPGSSEEEIKRAYRELSKVWHPDRFAAEDVRMRTRAEEKLKQLNWAYQEALRSHKSAGVDVSHSQSRSDASTHEEGRGAFRKSPANSLLFWLSLAGLAFIGLRTGLLGRSLLVSLITLFVIITFSASLARTFGSAQNVRKRLK